MTKDSTEIIEHIKALSDEELLKMLEDNPSNYSPLARQFAEHEFTTRNNSVLAQKLKEKREKQAQEAEDAEKRAKRTRMLIMIPIIIFLLLIIIPIGYRLYLSFGTFDIYTLAAIVGSIVALAGYFAIWKSW